MKKFPLLMLAAALVSTACTTSKNGAADQATLTAHQWKIVKVYDQPAVGEETPTMAFEADRVYGNTGCNNYFAQYTIDGNRLTLTNAGATNRLCANAGSEAAILKALNEIASFRLDKKTVLLYDASGNTLFELSR